MVADDSTTRWSTDDQAYLHAATELLSAGQYEHLAELLHRVQLAYDKQGDTIPAHVLVLARRICLACSQSQAEANWHQQACEEAAQREDKLRHQLTTLLDLVGERDLSIVPGEWDTIPPAPTAMLGPSASDMPELLEAPSLLQRIQALLHWRLSPQPHKKAVSKVRVQGPAPPTHGRAEGRVFYPTEEEQTPSRSPAEVTHAPPPSPLQATAGMDLSPARPKHEASTDPPADMVKPKEPSTPSLVVYCLGPFRVYQDDQPVDDWPSSRGKAIFKYLVTRRERPVAKEVLMELFWPDTHPDGARNNLNVAIYGLRKALRKARPSFSHVLYQDESYLVNPDLQVWVDVEEFTERLESARRLEEQGALAAAMREFRAAEALYQGDFLEEDRYEDWPATMRQNLQGNYLSLLDRLSDYYLAQEDYTACAAMCRKLLSVDSCCEEAYRRLMKCYSAQHQHFLALRQYHLCVEMLRTELDVAPAPATTRLYEYIRGRQHF